ncbi:MAG TPA: AtpZ/AtpI family protein [Rhizomicrobium sp.]|jgi:ATP synthase protein I|nr:AtpZ/AtpI family protein [Rhizomicrobium sp.]
MSDPGNLRDLSQRLDDAERRNAPPATGNAPPTQMGIAFRFATELVAALLVGGAIGWGLDWLFGRFGVHTRPVFLIVMVILGAAAGIRGVMRAANEINAGIAGQSSAPSARDDKES